MGAMPPVTMGADMLVPSAAACPGSTRRHRGSAAPPSGAAGQWASLKMLLGEPGGAWLLIAPMTHAPGAEISGFGTPVTVGPALENQHTSPSTKGAVASTG